MSNADIWKTIGDIELTDFYDIYEFGYGKYIHILGYAYYAGDSSTDNPDEIYREVEYCGFDLPLADYLTEGFDYGDTSAEVTQYIGDMTEQDVEDYLIEMIQGRERIDLNNLTMETPCGRYYGNICGVEVK